MIHAYFDDSADPKMKEYAVCGGMVGDAFNVTVTENLWMEAIKHLKEPFRSTDCECQHGQFKEWSKPDCNALMDRLVGMLCQEPIRTGLIGTAVPIELFHDNFPGSHRNDPYRLALRHVLLGVVHVCRRYSERAKLWFERGPNDGDISKAYNDFHSYNFPDAFERIVWLD